MVINVCRGAVVAFELSEQECLIECLEGRLWITKTGDGMDYCLEAGDRRALFGSGRVVIGAVAAARIGITRAADIAIRVNEYAWPASDRLGAAAVRGNGGAPGGYRSLPGKYCQGAGR
jgi:hypothetical protein